MVLKKVNNDVAHAIRKFCKFVAMKKRIQKIVACAMALLLLVSTVSWTIEKHYCLGALVDVAFFKEAQNCGMDMELASEEDGIAKDMDGCCSNEVVVVEGQQDLTLSWDDISLEQQVFLYVFTQTYTTQFKILEEHIVPHKNYPPPILIRDSIILDQVFLI